MATSVQLQGYQQAPEYIGRSEAFHVSSSEVRGEASLWVFFGWKTAPRQTIPALPDTIEKET
jgi:hypothetical protein